MRDILINLRGTKSQSDVALNIGITQKHLSAIERGKRNPSINVMKRFESYYNRPMTELFSDIFLAQNTTNCS